MTTPESVIAHVTIAAEAAAGKFGTNIVAFDVSQQLAITDVFLIVSAKNERQVAAVVEAVEEQLIKQAELKPVRREGDRENRWVLLDYIDFVVHVQHTEERSLYNLQIPLEVDEIPQDDDQ